LPERSVYDPAAVHLLADLQDTEFTCADPPALSAPDPVTSLALPHEPLRALITKACGRRAAQRLSAPRGARDGGDTVVRRETGDQTDQESRSADPRAAASVTAMDITIHANFLPHDDPDASLAFYRDRPEVVPVVLLLLRAGPG
jgi:hypothetical protein